MSYSISPNSGRHHLGMAAEWPAQGPPGGGVPDARDYPPARDYSHGGGSRAGKDPGWWDPAAAPVQPWTPPVQAAPYAEPAGPSPHDDFWADLRRQVAYTLRSVNAKHCHEAFDRLTTRTALSPQGAVLFYTLPAPDQPQGYRLFRVVRLNFTGPEYDNMAVFLRGLTATAAKNIAHARATGRRWDPRGPERSLVNGGDLDMPRDATYVGVGTTSLDTEHGDWLTVAYAVRNQPLVKSSFDIPGQGQALLTDGTALRVLRDPNRRAGDDGIRCNKTLDAHRARHWNPGTNFTEQGDPPTRAAWQELAKLQQTLQGHLAPGRPV